MKQRITAIALAVALLAIVITGASLALFNDVETINNVFVPVGSSLEDGFVLYETLVEKASQGHEYNQVEGTTVTSNTYDGIIPGDLLPKDPTLDNGSDVDAYTVVAITLSNAEAWNEFFDENTDDTYEDFLDILNGFNSKFNFIKMIPDSTTDSETYYFQYDGVLAAGAKEIVFTDVDIPLGIDNNVYAEITEGNFTIDVLAYAIQAANVDTENSLSSIEDEFGLDLIDEVSI